MENLRYIIVSSLYKMYIAILLFRILRHNLSTKNVDKINPMESGYFWGKSWYFNEKSLKNGKSHRYIIVSYLYIAILLLFRSLRYNLSTKNCLPKSTLWKVVILGVKLVFW